MLSKLMLAVENVRSCRKTSGSNDVSLLTYVLPSTFWKVTSQGTADIGAAAAADAGAHPWPYTFRATGSVIKFPGFLSVYREGQDTDEQDELEGCEGAEASDLLPKLVTI